MQNMPNCRRPIPTPRREYSVPGSYSSCQRPESRENRCPGNMTGTNICRGFDDCEKEFPPAMAYVPWQRWGEIYPPDEGLRRGTIFPVLYKPLNCTGGMKHDCK